MGESEAKSTDKTAAPAKPEMTFAEFLESCPPETNKWVSFAAKHDGTSIHAVLVPPPIRIYCNHEHCNGVRTFESADHNYLSSDWELEFLTYLCRNCRRTMKNFALVVRKDGNHVTTANVYKIGELPIFGPPTPARLISLVGEDRELFLSGRRAELRGLGIGAFAYYRRVVEEQKGRIIREIGKVASRLNASPETLRLFAEAEKETQFSSAIDKIKTAIPESLRINGQNPLTLLHTALSEGLHDKTDAECLELATSIRLVLAELAERVATPLKDEEELRGAVNKLLSRNSSKP